MDIVPFNANQYFLQLNLSRVCANPPELGTAVGNAGMRSRKQPRDRVKNKARQSREQKSAAGSNTTIRNKQLCAARDSEKAPKHKRLPRSCSTSMCCERFRQGPKHKRISRSCSTSTCCERFRKRPKAQAFTRMLFNIYVLPEIQTRPQSTSGYPCSTSICCEIFGEGPKTQAFTPILFNIFVLLGIYRRPQSISVYPNLLQYLRAARDSKKPQSTSVYPYLVRYLRAVRDF